MNNIDTFFKTLKTTNTTLESLIDIKKIKENLNKHESNLKALNYLLVDSKEEFVQRLEFLFNKDSKVFDSILILSATRADKNHSSFLIDGEIISINEITSSIENILMFFEKTSILELILSNTIKDFYQYVLGIEVGMDTNARKNRTGSKIEKELIEFLNKEFSENKDIVIKEQVKYHINNQKKLIDISIENKKTNKTILIESSFYNSRGSKISETARSYNDMNKKILEWKDSNYKFIWLADGNGITTIRKIITAYWNDGYIWNHHRFYKEIKNFVEEK